MITEQEAQLYARMTFKQYGFPNLKLVFMDDMPARRLGQANPWHDCVELSTKTLANTPLFIYVLKHELSHILQFHRMGGTYKVNGRNNFHGKVFKECCRELGISHKTTINA